MRLELAFFAKAVETDTSGVFSALSGGIEMIDAARLPGTFPSLCLVLLVMADTEQEQGEHRFKLELQDPDQDIILTHSDRFSLTRQPCDVSFELPHRATITLLMQNLELRKVGKYQCHIYFDENLVKTMPLCLRLAEPKP